MSIVISNNTKIIVTTNVDSNGDILTGINDVNSFMLSSILKDSLNIIESTDSSETVNFASFIGDTSNLSSTSVKSKTATITFDSYASNSTDFKNLIAIYVNSNIVNNTLPFTITSKLPKLFGIIVLLDNKVSFYMSRCFIESVNIDLSITDIVKASFSIKSFNSTLCTHTSQINTSSINISMGSIVGTISVPSIASYCLGKYTRASIVYNSNQIMLPVTSASLSNSIQTSTYNNAASLGSSNCFEYLTGISNHTVSCNISVYNRISKFTSIINEFLSYNIERPYIDLDITLVSDNTNILSINLIGCQLDYSSNFSSRILTDTMLLKLANPSASNSSNITWHL